MLLKLTQSNARHRNLITLKFVSIPMVAFGGSVAAIGGILGASSATQLGLAALGLVAGVAAFVFSFLDGAIAWQRRRTVKRIAKANRASTRYEGVV